VLTWRRQRVVELPAGGDAQFGEHLAEVPFHGAGADKQFRADLMVGASVPGQPDDVLLLRGELVAGNGLAFADLLAGGEQFPPRALGEGFGADRGEQVVGGVQLMTRVEPPVLATEPLPIEQPSSGQLGAQRRAAQPLDRLGVVILGILAIADQRARTRLQAFAQSEP
jgi:hypothetical protein